MANKKSTPKKVIKKEPAKKIAVKKKEVKVTQPEPELSEAEKVQDVLANKAVM